MIFFSAQAVSQPPLGPHTSLNPVRHWNLVTFFFSPVAMAPHKTYILRELFFKSTITKQIPLENPKTSYNVHWHIGYDVDFLTDH